MDYKSEISAKFEVGDVIKPHLRVKTIGRKYITCVSIMDYTHTVRYTFREFYEAFY